jgi:hypothetical protein
MAKYQMTFVRQGRRHWAFFETAASALVVWQSVLANDSTDIEVLENPNQGSARSVSLLDLGRVGD